MLRPAIAACAALFAIACVFGSETLTARDAKAAAISGGTLNISQQPRPFFPFRT